MMNIINKDQKSSIICVKNSSYEEDIEEKLIGQEVSNLIPMGNIKALCTKLTIGGNNYWLEGLTMGGSSIEAENHTGTRVSGKYVLIFHYFNISTNVSGFDESLEIVNGRSEGISSVDYNDYETGRVIMLIIQQTIWILTMNHNIL